MCVCINIYSNPYKVQNVLKVCNVNYTYFLMLLSALLFTLRIHNNINTLHIYREN